MALTIKVPEPALLKPKISIFGIGGAGGNALNNMIRSNLEGVEFIAANTDAQSLANSLASNRIQLGLGTTKGLGAGSFPDRGRAAAEENIDEIQKYLEGNNMVFITAGMGGGTGTGAAPVIAKLARERDILTVGVVTKPFQFEGKYRMDSAELGIAELKKCVDTLIVIPNQNLFRIANEQTTFESAFQMADNVLHAGVRGITDLITMPGLVNLDFADIRTIMTKMGKALMGTGEAEGENRAIRACEEAISNPLLDDISIRGAKGVLVNMTGGSDMTLFEADFAVNAIKKEVDPNANIIFGSAFNENMKGKIRISVVATGIDDDNSYNEEPFKTKLQKPYEIRKPIQKEEITTENTTEKKSFFDMESIKDLGQLSEQQTSNVVNNSHFKELSEHQETEHNFSDFSQNENNPSDIPQEKDAVSFNHNLLDKNLPKLTNEVNQLKSFKQPIAKTSEIETKDDKKDGFHLFGFLGFSQQRNKIEEDKPRNSTRVEPKKNNKKYSIVEDDEEDLISISKTNQQNYQEEEMAKLDRIPDEDELSEENEDDLLNVPAFFRRKKD